MELQMAGINLPFLSPAFFSGFNFDFFYSFMVGNYLKAQPELVGHKLAPFFVHATSGGFRLDMGSLS